MLLLWRRGTTPVRSVDERRLKVLAVNVEACLVRVGVVHVQRHERVHDAFDEPLVDHGAVSVVFGSDGGSQW